MDCSIHVAKTKALISFADTAKLICIFVFAYSIGRFSHNEAHIGSKVLDTQGVCCNQPKIHTKRSFHRDICPNGVDEMTNSADPDLTAVFEIIKIIYI